MNIFMKLNPIFINFGDFQIRWYAVFILCGAIVAYLITKYIVKKSGYDKDLTDDVLFAALPAGIIGARIWWCISDSASPWHHGNFWGVITEFRDGGLAVQGGVIFGIIAGILVMRIKYKEIGALFILDAALPNVLIAQAIGRWGNFMNQEVYGACVNYEDLNFLPNFIQEQMRGDMNGSLNVGEFKEYYAYINCQTNQAAQPLFLYESLLNILGFVLISILARKFWKKGRVKGDLAGLYLIWYGVVRFVLEPLRNSEFIMSGWGNMPVSQITSLLFIIAGVLFMVGLRIVPKLFKKEIKND